MFGHNKGLQSPVYKALAVLTVVLLIAVAGMLSWRPAAAQSNGLGVTPKLSFTIEAGRQHSDSLYVNNLSTSQPLHLKIRAVDFKAQDESGTPVLLQSVNEPLTPWSLKPYITLPDTATIEPGKSRRLPFTVKIPANLGAGSYYSAIEYTAVNDPNQQRVNVAARSATLMFVTVPGEASQLLNLLQFGALKGDNFSNLFTGQAPTNFAYRVKNSGNLSESPAGSIVIKDMFGRTAGHIDDVNPRSELALIGQTRRITVCNPKSTEENQLGKEENCTPLKLKPGRYTAEIVLFYGQNGQPSRQISATAAFWYLPLWFLAAFVLAVAAVAYLVYRIYRRFGKSGRRHKKHR